MMTHMANYQTEKGFTLIEVMLAIAITAFVAMLSYNALSAAISSADRHEKKAGKLADIQLALTVLERDIRHAIRRSIRDDFDYEQAALLGGGQEQYILQLTRRGWDNPIGNPRSELQRVRYELEGEELWRESWQMLDRVSEDETLQKVLVLGAVKEFNISFLEGSAGASGSGLLGGEWTDSWDTKDDRLPLAVEIELDIEDFGRVKRVFDVPSPQ